MEARVAARRRDLERGEMGAPLPATPVKEILSEAVQVLKAGLAFIPRQK